MPDLANPLVSRTGGLSIATGSSGQLVLGPFPPNWVADLLVLTPGNNSNADVDFAAAVCTEVPPAVSSALNGFSLIQPGNTTVIGLPALALPQIGALIRQLFFHVSNPLFNTQVWLACRFVNDGTGTGFYAVSVKGHIAQ